MKVGLTYDLRSDYLAEGFSEEETAEFDRPDTIEAIENTLSELGYETERIGNIKALVQALNGGQRWDLVFNIAEGVHGFGREAQVPALLDAYDIPYTFSDPLVLGVTLHKGMTKQLIRDLGLPTAKFAVVERIEDLKRLRLKYPLFAKPVAEGTGKGIDGDSLVYNHADLLRTCNRLLERFEQPVLVEEYLPGRDFTVGLVGTGRDARVVGVLEAVLTSAADACGQSYRNKEQCERLVIYKLAEDDMAQLCADIALKAWRGLKCRDAGRVDLRANADGIPNFIEVNPLAGINPVHSDLPILCNQIGVPYKQLIAEIMESALSRLPATLGKQGLSEVKQAA